ncbi:hypothetical protein [uncultured Mucilaginibacter sp.]|uniref:hypothetical protein n=1 Tax=uncultured Mucilaginibacter sp. TaxID=797541 RepID=UPI0025F30DC6|nr:hypothetical protein [uncultured Mucilaginibacter sp.]
MKEIRNKIVVFFTAIDYNILRKSLIEVMWLTVIALFPLIINIAIAGIAANDFIEPIKTKILPGETLSYCLSFLAPSLYLLTRLQGSSYKLPLLHGFSIITLLLYVATIVLYLITKNKWVKQINLEPHGFDVYFKLTASFFIMTIILRIYAIYHGRQQSSYLIIREQQQKDFNEGFANSLNTQK